MPKSTASLKRAPAKAAPRASPRTTTAGAINIRVRDEDRALFDQAALLLGKSRSEFML